MNHLTIGDRLTYFAVWAAVAALGALGVLFSLEPIERHIELSNLRFAWPTVEGRVVSSSARVTHYDETSRTHVQVRFTYKVDGQRFSAEQKWSTFLGASAKDIEKQYSPGTPLTVYPGIPQIKPTFLDIAPSGIPSNIIPHSKGVKCGLIRSNSPFSYSNHRPAKPKIPKPLVYAQVSPLGTSFATP